MLATFAQFETDVRRERQLACGSTPQKRRASVKRQPLVVESI
jgi:hypothetical protein